MNFNFSKYLVSLLLMMAIIVLSSDKAYCNDNDLNKYAALVIDANSGKILYQENAGKQRYPASLAKMMTLYITFDAIDKGKIKVNEKIKVSNKAARQPRSKLGLKKGEFISVKDAILSLITKSANDSAVVIAEKIAGSEEKFAKLMNQYAHMLGMNHTNFVNSSGLHNVNQTTTAYDMARLALAIKRDFKKYYHYFSTSEFKFRNQVIESHNHITKSFFGADGLKTGFTNASGYNIVSSAQRGTKRLITVVMGGKNAKSRDLQVTKLMNKFFILPRKDQYLIGNNYISATNKEDNKDTSQKNIKKIKYN